MGTPLTVRGAWERGGPMRIDEDGEDEPDENDLQ
jgi:hypothetical protein